MNFTVFDDVGKRNKKRKIVTTNINLFFHNLFLSIECITTTDLMQNLKLCLMNPFVAEDLRNGILCSSVTTIFKFNNFKNT